MSETPDTELAAEPVAQLPYLIGVRMRVPLQAEAGIGSDWMSAK